MAKALSLKYRPNKFGDLIGQDSISQTLSLALKLNRVSHAYLFSGLRGSGKTSTARIFAKALQCEKYPNNEPCLECDACKSAVNNMHIDIIEMDAASSRSIDDIKNLIEQVQYRPAFGRFKIFIIDEIHMLTKEAFNALLKTLEEPPEYVKFILATTDPLKLPATILSRTQHFRFKKIPQKNISAHMQRILNIENIKFEDGAIDLLAKNCGGSLRDALTMLEQAIIFSKENVTLNIVSDMIGALNPNTINDYFNAIFKKDEEKIESILLDFENYEVDNIIDEMISFLKDRMLNKDSSYNLIIIDRFFKILNNAKQLLALNSDSNFVLLLTTLKFKESLNIQEINKVIAKIEQEVLKDIKEINLNATTLPVIDNSTKNIQDSKIIISPFKILIDKIYDRDYKVGEIFERNVKFISFNENTLIWESKAKGEDKETLRKTYSVILALAKEVFGKTIKIKSISNIQSINEKDNNEIDKKINISFNQEDSKNIQKDINIYEEPLAVKNIKSIFNITEIKKETIN